jgi:hypothetical protein
MAVAKDTSSTESAATRTRTGAMETRRGGRTAPSEHVCVCLCVFGGGGDGRQLQVVGGSWLPSTHPSAPKRTGGLQGLAPAMPRLAGTRYLCPAHTRAKKSSCLTRGAAASGLWGTSTRRGRTHQSITPPPPANGTQTDRHCPKAPTHACTQRRRGEVVDGPQQDLLVFACHTDGQPRECTGRREPHRHPMREQRAATWRASHRMAWHGMASQGRAWQGRAGQRGNTTSGAVPPSVGAGAGAGARRTRTKNGQAQGVRAWVQAARGSRTHHRTRRGRTSGRWTARTARPRYGQSGCACTQRPRAASDGQ